MSSAFSVADIPGIVCFTPCPFLLLVLVSVGYDETLLVDDDWLTGAGGVCTKGSGGSPVLIEVITGEYCCCTVPVPVENLEGIGAGCAVIC